MPFVLRAVKDVVLEMRTVPSLQRPLGCAVHGAGWYLRVARCTIGARTNRGKLSARWIIRLGKRLIVFMNRLHSELALWSLGHESSGTVVEVGSCRQKHLNVGDRVAIRDWHVPCRQYVTIYRNSRCVADFTPAAITAAFGSTTSALKHRLRCIPLPRRHISKYYIQLKQITTTVPAHMNLEEAALVELVASLGTDH